MATLIISTERLTSEASYCPRTFNQVNNLFGQNYVQIVSPEDEYSPGIFETDSQITLVFGTPILDDWVDWSRDNILTLITAALSEPKRIDSVFVIFVYDKKKRTCQVITDRYGFFPIYWVKLKNRIIFCTSFNTIVRYLKRFQALKIDQQKLYEFFWMRRLFGAETLIQNIYILPPASTISVHSATYYNEQTYWVPQPIESSELSENEYAELVADTLTSAITLSLKSSKRSGLMLSGGLDSRALLAVGRSKYASITNTVGANNEYKIAQELARSVGSSHYHLVRPKDYLSEIFDSATRACDATTLYYECQFLGYIDELKQVSDSIHLGLFLDVFFCGHYMPKFQPQFMGRYAVHFRFNELPKTDLARYFVNNISYRQKSTSLKDVVSKNVNDRYFDGLENTISDLMRAGEDAGFRGIPLWEYCHLTNVGRHYSTLMARSLLPYVQVWLPVLNIKSYDLAFQIPVKFKYNWSVYLKALKRLDSQLMQIPNSNTNISAHLGLRTQTMVKAMRGSYNLVRPGSYVTSPTYDDRSWPPVNESITENHKINNKILELMETGKVLEMGMFRKDMLRTLYDKTVSKKEDHSVFLNQLLTVEYGLMKYL